jgi:hypothetical protein
MYRCLGGDAVADIDTVTGVPSLKEAARLVRYFSQTYKVIGEADAAQLHGVLLRTGEDASRHSDVYKQLQPGFDNVFKRADQESKKRASMRPGGRKSGAQHDGKSPRRNRLHTPCLRRSEFGGCVLFGRRCRHDAS